MQDHLDDLREVQHLLVTGKLREAKAIAFMLTRPAPDLAWSPDGTRAGVVAWSLANASTVPEAADRMTHVAAACGTCHQRNEATITLSTPARPEAIAARHGWAATRLLEGLVTASDARWRAALEVLAEPIPGNPAAGSDLRERARAGLARIPRETLAERRVAYQRMLVACLACHSEARR